MKNISTRFLNQIIKPDDEIVLCRFFEFSKERTELSIAQIEKLSEDEVKQELNDLRSSFSNRHRDIEKQFLMHYHAALNKINGSDNSGSKYSPSRQLLIGAYFTYEYSHQAAALFNPSIVPLAHSDIQESSGKSHILSLRAAGEGHISSISFRGLQVFENGDIELNLPSKLVEKGEIIRWNSSKNYLVQFDPASKLEERVLFPAAPWESNGMEDLRLLRFAENDDYEYLGTYTAYDGKQIQPALLRTNDFLTFDIRLLEGEGAQNKNHTIFPRKINGSYKMLARIDGRNHYILTSDNLYHWDHPKFLAGPQYPWEFIQVGNNGSPLETKEGWLVITHGVGSMRQYYLSAMLLDLENPDKVIGRLDKPLLSFQEDERNGYVPNVLYSCGSAIVEKNLLLPYAASDKFIRFASIQLNELLAELIKT